MMNINININSRPICWSVDDDVKHLHRDPSSRRILICVTVSLLLTFLNLLISYIAPAAVNSTHDRYTSRAQRLKDADLLYRPDMYIGLDRVDADVERLALPESLHVLPHVFAPVNRSDPGKIFPSDGRSRTTFNGVVSPGEPHVIINKDVNAILFLSFLYRDNLALCICMLT